MQYKKIITLVSLLVLVVVMSPTFAKEKEKNDELARVAMITAKDGQSKALEEAIVGYHHYMADKKGAWRYQWYKIETGPDTGSYIARSGGHNWADFDAEHSWDEAAGAKFASDVQPYVGEVNVSITQTDMELGIWPESMKGYKYFQLSRWHIKTGKNDEFDEGIKKIDGILKKGNWPNYYAFIKTVSGGHGNTRLLVSPRKNFADMAPKKPDFMGILGKAMGEDEAKAFLAEWSKTYKTGSYYMLRYLPKQSDYGDAK